MLKAAVTLPKSFDWRDKNVIPNAKNQGACGCCWVFSGTSHIEAVWRIKNSKIISLSEQEIVDCQNPDVRILKKNSKNAQS